MPVLGGKAELVGNIEDAVEVEADGGAGFLGHFVFNGEIEVVRAIGETFEGSLILGEHRGADMSDVVQEDAAEC